MIEGLTPLPDVEPGIYSHYRQGDFRVHGVVRDDATTEPLVLISPADGGEVWARAHSTFAGEVVVEGRLVPRYRLVRADADEPDAAADAGAPVAPTGEGEGA